MLTDEQIAAMTREERRDLMLRLGPGQGGLGIDAARLRGIRRRRLALMTVGAAALVPWTVYLSLTLPARYVVHNWSLTWVGFDVILTLMFAATAILGLLRRHLVVLSASTAGILLLCDAWFDITTADSHDRPWSVGFALLAEVPIAILLISGAMRLVHMRLVESAVIDERTPLWRAPLFVH